MQISTLLQDDEILKFQEELYSYFETGYSFEEFLKEYLIEMGLDEVQITQRSRDGGIDLMAIRKGVGDFSEIDTTHYYIQAKRYALNNKISVSKIRELKGTIPFGYKGMFITTSTFTNEAQIEAVNDPSKPVVTIDGKALVMSCIDHQIGFLYKPIFSKKQLDNFLKRDTNVNPVINSILHIEYIEKLITKNDIRARIVSIPSKIMEQFNENQPSVKVNINNDKNYTFNIVRGRNYFGGVTTFLKEFSLLSDEGTISPKKSKWFYDKENATVKIYLEELND